MTRRDPFDEIEDLLERMGREFEELGGTLDGPEPKLPPFPGSRTVPVDVFDDGESITVVADLPGFDAADVDVELRDDALVIGGSRDDAGDDGTSEEAGDDGASDDAGDEGDDDAASEAADDGVRYHRRERRPRSLSRRVSLPEPVERDAATASYDAGVLTVTLPRRSSSGGGHTIDVD